MRLLHAIRNKFFKKIRFGLRLKLLAFFSLAMLAVVILDIIVQVSSFSSMQEFEVRLSRYHSIHRLRLSLDSYQKIINERFRVGVIPSITAIQMDFRVFEVFLDDIQSTSPESQSAFFNIRAIERGIEAYMHHLKVASFRRASADADWYQTFAYAERISGYIDNFLSDLLSEVLDEGELSYKEIVKRANSVQLGSLVALILMAAGFSVFSVFFSWTVSAPVTRLSELASRLAAGDLEVPELKSPTGDEVETLTNAFNHMSKNIRAMVEDLKDKSELQRRLLQDERDLLAAEKALQEARFMNLQDQIRPHFLFNALNTIARMALLENAASTEQLTLALARLLRYSLGPADALVPLKQELDILRAYLSFQAKRFGPRLEWDIQSSAAAEKILIPRFTLQPLVENAVRHGIEPLLEHGRVEVSAHICKGVLQMVVQDNGVGMRVPSIENLNSGDSGGIGLRNVISRLHIVYGGLEQIDIYSESGQGSKIIIRIPLDAVS
jgi:two-component system, sensor histidine kinase YesM